MKKIAINGFGRIGRLTLRQLLEQESCEVVAINDLSDVHTLAHLFKYDSTQGRYEGEVLVDGNNLVVNGCTIPVFNEPNPALIPWASLGVDICIECTGFFLDPSKARGHLIAGASRVLLSAPAKGPGVPTVVLGASELNFTADDTLISNASCSTNCLALMIKVLQDNWGVKEGFMSTIHAYTGNQRLIDAPSKDLRRSRAAAQNLIPTTTGAAKALALIFPELDGKINASCIRVPVATGSLIELYVKLLKPTTAVEVNKVFQDTANSRMKGFLEYATEPLVSTDIIGNPASCILDSLLTTMQGDMLKLTAWYDNEAGYSARLADLSLMI